MSENIKHVSDASFDQDVLKSATPVLVDYWAEWCGPCKMIAPVLEDIAKQYAGKLMVAKLDIDANPGITAKFGIRGIPTLILFKDGKPHAQKVGALSKSQLTAFVDSNLSTRYPRRRCIEPSARAGGVSGTFRSRRRPWPFRGTRRRPIPKPPPRRSPR
jgi:thioredoxin 1